MLNGEDAMTLLLLLLAIFVYIVDLITDDVTIILNLCITLSLGSLTAVPRLIFYQAATAANARMTDNGPSHHYWAMGFSANCGLKVVHCVVCVEWRD